MPSYPIVILQTIHVTHQHISKQFTSKLALLSYLHSTSQEATQQTLAILFSHNSHLDDPTFLAKILAYQSKPNVSAFNTHFNENAQTYTITIHFHWAIQVRTDIWELYNSQLLQYLFLLFSTLFDIWWYCKQFYDLSELEHMVFTR